MKQPRRTRLKPPYKANGKTSFPARDRAGVYLIYKAGRLRYVGYSGTDVYKALYRHFETWNDRRGDRVTYKHLQEVRVRVIYCPTRAQASKLERALIIRHRPQDNPDKLREYLETPRTAELADSVDSLRWTKSEEAPF